MDCPGDASGLEPEKAGGGLKETQPLSPFGRPKSSTHSVLGTFRHQPGNAEAVQGRKVDETADGC